MFEPVWSPDSKKLAWADKDLRLWYVDINDKKPVEVDRGKYAEITNYSWSPDSKWIAYDSQVVTNNSVVYLYSTVDKKSTPVTDELVNSIGPVWDPEGKYLCFFSDRDFNELVGNVDFEFANPKTTRVYVLTLKADTPSPFPALSDETAIKREGPVPQAAAAESDKDKKKADTKSKEAKADTKKKEDETKGIKETEEIIKNFRIDLEGLQSRIVALPIPPASLTALGAAKNFIYYSSQPLQGLSGPIPGEQSAIHVYDLTERKEKTLIEGIDRWWLSFDGSKLMYEVKGGEAKSYGIIDAKPGDSPKKVGEGSLSLSGLRAEIEAPPLPGRDSRNVAPRRRGLRTAVYAAKGRARAAGFRRPAANPDRLNAPRRARRSDARRRPAHAARLGPLPQAGQTR